MITSHSILSSPAQAAAPSFLSYDTVGGVPTRIIRSSAATSKFRCLAFSPDGTRLATGESNGTFRIWDTASYRLVAEASALFGVEVATLSFVANYHDVFIAIDAERNVVEFSIDPGNEVQNTVSTHSVKIWRRITLDIDRAKNNLDRFLSYQFADEGRMLIVVKLFPEHVIHVYRFIHSETEKILLSSDLSPTGQPAISLNGRGLLAQVTDHHGTVGSTADEDVIYVWPDLDFSSKEQQMLRLDGDRAVWGGRGEYLLVWNDSSGTPQLSVYTTESLRRLGCVASPFARRTFDKGLSSWSAQMMPLVSQEASPQILICENRANETRRFLVWDAIHGIITREVYASMPPRQVVGEDPVHAEADLDGTDVEDTLAFRVASHHAHQNLAIEDEFPKFSASRDGHWLGVFSWTAQACCIASTASRMSVWNFAVPQIAAMQRSPRRPQVAFDYFDRHFLVIGDSAILACAPSFLLLDFDEASNRASSLPRSISPRLEQNCKALFDCFDALPSRALAKYLQLQWTRNNALPWRRYVSWGWERRSIVDAAFTQYGVQLAFISKDNGLGHVSVYTLTAGADEDAKCIFLASRDSAEVGSVSFDFIPDRVFFYQDAAGDDKVMLCSVGYEPVALFAEDQSAMWERVPLGMVVCLSVSLTEDRDRLLLLDAEAVCMMDLTQKQITKRINYKVSFAQIWRHVHTSSRWRHVREAEAPMCTEGRLSEDGQSVLLGWDAINQRSIVVNPSTSQNMLNAVISVAEGGLSEYCVLTPNAECTCFVDVAAFEQGDIVVGVFLNTSNHISLATSFD